MRAYRKSPLAPVFFALLAPFGISKGYALVALSFHLSKAGMTTADVAAIVSFAIWPQTWKVFWAPALDTCLNAKSWYAMGAILTSLTIVAISSIRPTLDAVPLLTFLVISMSIASTFVSMSSELFMAHGVEDERKGTVAGWAQAGNVGGAGIGGGLGLYLSQHVTAPWEVGASLMVPCAACCLALFLVDEPRRETPHPPYREALAGVASDVWTLVRSRSGMLVMVLMVLPIGSGGMLGIWPAIAKEWGAKANVVALVNGALGGLAALVGAVLAGFLYDRVDRRTAYCSFGLAIATVAGCMALLPKSPASFIACTLIYAMMLGACYAGYSATVLEAIGRGAAATKINILGSIANIPVAIMIGIDGRLHDQFGTSDMLYAEAGIPFLSAITFAAFARLTYKRSGLTISASCEPRVP